VTVRASRAGDALTIRARPDDEDWQLVRLAPIDPALPWRAGPFCAAPTRAGLTVRFTRFALGPADGSLH
jgi:regulation of enolase protein 1 (concanavalin A-like superfamily)